MPTVAAPSLAAQHHDARAASGAFLLDAGELCCSSAFLPGISDLGASLHVKGAASMLHHGHGRALCDPDSLLLGGLPYSDDELSGGANHMGSSGALQFLLLDDDEAPQPSCMPAASGAAACGSTVATQHDMLRQHSGHSSDAVRTTVPLVDSSSLYCLAVVDEVTGLPLRPATPEETWEVERCFVLQEHSELLDAVLPQEQATAPMLPLYQPVQELQHYQQPEVAQHTVDGLMDAGLVAEVQLPAAEEAAAPATSSAAAVEARSGSAEPQVSESDEQEEQQQSREEQRKAEQAAKRKGPNPPPNRRPDQPRRCGPCDNCGATESPQWRQGPPAKPLLCNACGMRFRRTNQLVAGETGASGNRAGARANKKPPAPVAVAEAEEEEQQQQQRTKAAKHTAPPMVGPDTKRPRRAAAVAAAATFAAAAIDVM